MSDPQPRYTGGCYAGWLDDPSLFRPRIAIFTRGRPQLALIPPGLKVYEGLPG